MRTAGPPTVNQLLRGSRLVLVGMRSWKFMQLLGARMHDNNKHESSAAAAAATANNRALHDVNTVMGVRAFKITRMGQQICVVIM